MRNSKESQDNPEHVSTVRVTTMLTDKLDGGDCVVKRCRCRKKHVDKSLCVCLSLTLPRTYPIRSRRQCKTWTSETYRKGM